VQLTLTQSLPLAGAVMVTTPQQVAFGDVLKGGEMFRQLNVPLLGIIENMSYYLCPHCGQPEPIFGEGAGEQLSRQLNAPLLSRVPLDPAVRAGGDGGLPVVLVAPMSPAGQAFCEAAAVLVEAIRSRPRPVPPTPSYLLDPDLPVIG
jgi:ATP-binding protein involved in chromosome partitioning